MLNKIIVQGRMVRDPELRRTPAGNAVANFTLAVERDREVDGERPTDFIDCVSWAGGAEFVSKYFRKGMMAIVSGRLQSRDWEDKDGNKRKAWEIVTDGVYFGEAKKG